MSSQTTLPTCIGFIMDGNRRWAKSKGLPVLMGHREGYQRFLDVIAWSKAIAIPHLVFYAFSTENWKRVESEVAAIIALFGEALEGVVDAKVRFIGDRTRFPIALQTKMAALEARPAYDDATTTVWIALSYGGRAEIVQAAETLRQAGQAITEITLSQALWSAGMPEPDLIIRTGGDMRLSNFLPWQSVYSELMFTDTYWPAFTKAEFTRMLAQYGERKRRFGA